MDLNSINEETFKKYKEFSDLNYEKFTSTHHYDDEYYRSLKEAYEKIENLKKIDYNLTLNLLISIPSFVFTSLLIVCLGIPGIKDSIACDSILSTIVFSICTLIMFFIGIRIVFLIVYCTKNILKINKKFKEMGMIK